MVNLNSPTNSTYTTSSITLNYSQSGSQVCWYTIDGGAKTTLASCTNTTLTTLSEAQHTLGLYANDTLGNLNSTNVSFIVDIPPVVTLDFPTNTSYNYTNLGLNFSSSDNESCWYSLNGGADTILVNCGNTTITPNQGQNTIVVYANDSFGNVNQSATIAFFIDSIIPVVTRPKNITCLANWTCSINWTMTDTNAGEYYVKKDATVQNATTIWTSGTKIKVWVNTTNTGYYNYSLYFNDSLNNLGNTSTVQVYIPAGIMQGNYTDVTTEGITSLNITIIDNSNGTSSNLTIAFSDGTSPLMNFTHDFATTSINLSKVKITVGTSSIIVNMSGQLSSGATKTLYLTDNGYSTLCIKDMQINSVDEISSTCTGTNETNFNSCLGVSTGTTINGKTCYDYGSVIMITNLSDSGILGGELASTGGSSTESLKTIKLTHEFNCTTGRLDVEAKFFGIPANSLDVKLTNTDENSATIEETNSNGQTTFIITRDGTYKLSSDSTTKYKAEETNPFTLELCPKEIPAELGSNETTNNTIVVHENLTQEDVLFALTTAKEAINSAKNNGKNTSEAEAMYSQASNAYENGSLNSAYILANQAIALAENVPLLESGTEEETPEEITSQEEPEQIIQPEEDYTLWYIIIGVVVLITAYLLLRPKKR